MQEMIMTGKSEYFDFGDPRGAVAAHRHSNGGGWVADTAHVGDTAFVGADARVGGFARVGGSARGCWKGKGRRIRPG